MSEFVHLHSIGYLTRLFRLDSPIKHPLIAVLDFGKVEHIPEERKVSAGFYCMIFKNYCRNHITYGRKLIDFQDGSLVCMAPNQVIELDYNIEISSDMMGWGVFFHPDLIRATALNDNIKNYTFFPTK